VLLCTHWLFILINTSALFFYKAYCNSACVDLEIIFYFCNNNMFWKFDALCLKNIWWLPLCGYTILPSILIISFVLNQYYLYAWYILSSSLYQFELGHLVARETFDSAAKTKDELGPKVSDICTLIAYMWDSVVTDFSYWVTFMVGTPPSSPKSWSS
jgi:glucan phosphoethanolaminetransferase (alkaline phosphatase superfamily)